MLYDIITRCRCCWLSQFIATGFMKFSRLRDASGLLILSRLLINASTHIIVITRSLTCVLTAERYTDMATNAEEGKKHGRGSPMKGVKRRWRKYFETFRTDVDRRKILCLYVHSRPFRRKEGGAKFVKCDSSSHLPLIIWHTTFHK